MSSTKQDPTVSLHYIQPEDKFWTEKPYELLVDRPDGMPSRNFSVASEPPEIIHDMRGEESRFALDTHGFTIRKDPMVLTARTKEAIVSQYLPQVEALLHREVEDVNEVFLFDWRLRTSDATKTQRKAGQRINLSDQSQYLGPVNAVHIDQSPAAALKRVQHHMGDRSETLSRQRFRIINIWRPLNYPVANHPLAVCDATTVRHWQCIAVDHVRKHYFGESLYPLYTPGYQWYYLSNQTKDEALLFKTYDSASWVDAKSCPHASFPLPDAAIDAPPRESIEVRALVF